MSDSSHARACAQRDTTPTRVPRPIPPHRAHGQSHRIMASELPEGAGHVVTVGNHQGSNPFSGLLDEVRIYSRALTLAEIQTDRTTPIVP